MTVHIVDDGVDTGPIVLQRAFPLSPFETGKSLYRKTLAFEPDVVVDALRRFEREGASCATPQFAARACHYPDRVPGHSEIDPSKSLLGVFNEIRAADAKQYPAYFYIEGQKVCVRLWRPDKPIGEDDLV